MIFPFASISSSINWRVTEMNSVCISCSPMVSDLTGWNVPAPTWSVNSRRAMPFLSMAASVFSVKCNPAVGAATEPSMRE